MPIEVAKTISVDARNTLVRHRDALQTKFGVSIFFPRNTVRGAYQDMIIKGGVNATTNAGREIDRILVGWRQEFEAFRQRQAFRKNQRRIQANPTEAPFFPTVAETVHTKNTPKPTSNNPFALLEHDTEPTIPTHSTPKTIKPNKPALKGWSTVAAKAPEPPKQLVSTNPPVSPQTFTFGSTSSGAAFTYNTQPFDWASAVDDEHQDNDTDDVWENW